MTDQQAVETLRRMELASRLMDRAGHAKERGDACQRGADAIEFNAWLFAPGRWAALYSGYFHSDVPGDFRAYCEQQWRASRA